ncbi:MAG: IclR family transcriptional regulator C-terminal domain-containing protein [Spirochaetia bacterium]
MNKPARAKAVVKTMWILECLSHERSVGITELTRRVSAKADGLRMNKSTVYRFLASLKELGFVRQDAATEQYSLTLKLFEIGMCVLDRLELWREAEPVLKEIAHLTGETIHLATLEENSLVYLGKIESTKTLRVSMMSRVGQTAPTHCTGVGKTLLAYLPPSRLSQILPKERLFRYTPRTFTRRVDLDRELASVREKGYAIDNEEHETGVRCVAAPVRDNKGAVCAAVSVSVPTVRFPDKEIPQYRDIIVRAAEEISKRIGYRAPHDGGVPLSEKQSRARRRGRQRRAPSVSRIQ